MIFQRLLLSQCSFFQIAQKPFPIILLSVIFSLLNLQLSIPVYQGFVCFSVFAVMLHFGATRNTALTVCLQQEGVMFKVILLIYMGED